MPADQTVTLTPAYPAKIIPLDMAHHPGCASPDFDSMLACCGSEEGSYLRLIDLCITQL